MRWHVSSMSSYVRSTKECAQIAIELAQSTYHEYSPKNYLIECYAASKSGLRRYLLNDTINHKYKIIYYHRHMGWRELEISEFQYFSEADTVSLRYRYCVLCNIYSSVGCDCK